MTIYTKTGDDGTTSLFGGRRLSKSDLRVEAYGTVDEFSSLIGLVIAKNKKTKKILLEVQKDLYQIMSDLSGAKTDLNFIKKRVGCFEKTIDQLTKKLPPLKNFILPQGSELACWFHVLRSVCRRTERSIVRYYKKLEIRNSKFEIIQYLNRLSDLFFILSRYYNNQKEVIIIK